MFAAPKKQETIHTYDLRYYYPVNFGLKDLSFDIRIENLESMLGETKSLPQIVDVFARVYWTFDNGIDVEILGMPKGFSEKKTALKKFITNRLDFVFPKKMLDKLEAYDFNQSNRGNFIVVDAEDKTGKEEVNKITLKFDKTGKLVNYTDYSPAGTRIFNLKMSPRPFSQNKWLYDEIEKISYVGLIKTITKYNFKYNKFDGIGFPEEISFMIKQILNSDDQKNPKKEFVFKLSSYRINKGIAKSYFKLKK